MPVPERWNLPLPDWDRYGVRGDYPYVERPLVGSVQPEQARRATTRSSASGRSSTSPASATRCSRGATCRRRAASAPSGPAARSSSAAAASTCRSRRSATSFDLFRGDTVFRPIDWRVRFAPAYSLNFVNLSEYNGVNADVRREDTRARPPPRRAGALRREEALRHRPSLRLHLGPRRHPGVHLRLPRLHGRARGARRARCSARSKSSRIEYNAGGLRPAGEGHQQRLQRDAPPPPAGLHRQRLRPGLPDARLHAVVQLPRQPTTAASCTTTRNGFLVRPAPIGVHRHQRGHRPTTSARRATATSAAGTSATPSTRRSATRATTRSPRSASTSTRRWARWSCRSTRTGCGSRARRSSPSGDGDPSDDKGARLRRDPRHPELRRRRRSASGTARGCASRRPAPASSRRVSLLPTLRTNKDEGQPNFVNPGVFLLNGAGRRRPDAEAARVRHHQLHPLPARPSRWRRCSSRRRFARTSASTTAAAFSYRPPLSDNIVIIGGVQAMKLGQGLKDIYERSCLLRSLRERTAPVLT